MSVLWRFCRTAVRRAAWQRRLFLLLNMVFFGLLGFMLWLIVSRWTLTTPDWAVVFTGFAAWGPGFMGGILYLYNH